jgi:hypothetical protein
MSERVSGHPLARAAADRRRTQQLHTLPDLLGIPPQWSCTASSWLPCCAGRAVSRVRRGVSPTGRLHLCAASSVTASAYFPDRWLCTSADRHSDRATRPLHLFSARGHVGVGVVVCLLLVRNAVLGMVGLTVGDAARTSLTDLLPLPAQLECQSHC